MSASAVNVVLAYVINILLPSQVVLVDPAVIVSVPSLALAVIVLLVAAVVFGCVIVIVGAVRSIHPIAGVELRYLIFPAASTAL